MSRTKRQKAQCISGRIDGLSGHRRHRAAPGGVSGAEDREVVELTRLARALSAIRIALPVAVRDEVARRLPAMAES